MNNYTGSGTAPAPSALTDRVIFLERGLELIASYVDAMSEHFGQRVSALEAHIYGAPQAAPFPTFREFAEQREKRNTLADEPRSIGAELRRDFRG